MKFLSKLTRKSNSVKGILLSKRFPPLEGDKGGGFILKIVRFCLFKHFQRKGLFKNSWKQKTRTINARVFC
ncbi:hypothetical protein D3C87_08120 [compost metagenome]